MTILLHSTREPERWIEGFKTVVPNRQIQVWPDVGDPSEIEFVVAWKHDWSTLGQHRNLKAVLLASAGTDHVDFDLVPPNVDVVRLVDPVMSDDIAQFCAHWVTHYARGFDQYRLQQSTATWDTGTPIRSPVVGILGLGAIGTVVGDRLVKQGYRVISWSRSKKQTPFGQHYSGADELGKFMAVSDTVVNLLPGSEATTGIVDEAALQSLGTGALINVGRGNTVDADALLGALDSPTQPLRGAVLDVFATEPLPAHSPLWTHPRITVTPHIAGETDPVSAAKVIGANIIRIEAGEVPFPVVTATTY